jgi:hypothetical protein
MCKTANLGDSLPKRMDIAKLLLLQSTPPKKKIPSYPARNVLEKRLVPLQTAKGNYQNHPKSSNPGFA